MSNPMVQHVAQREQHLFDLMEKLGVDRSRFTRDAHGATLEKASWNCVRCAHPSACKDWVRTLRELPMKPPFFCPNCDLLRSFFTLA